MFSKNLTKNQIRPYLLEKREDDISSKDDQFLDFPIPENCTDFYNDFGYLTHPKTGEPVEKLADYQIKIWDDRLSSKYRLILKSQKVGITTSVLMEDFQDAVTRYKGQDILVISQTQYHSNEHLRTLKNLVLNSEKYRRFLITEPSELLLREEKTKVGVAYIKNPDSKYKPTRIIALGASEQSVWSWKNIAKIHMSDIAATSMVDDNGLFAAAFSRLANTDGSMIIETPPRGARGRVHAIYEQIQKGESEFSLHIVRAEDAVKHNLITFEFLNAEKIRLGSLYPQYYEAVFIEGFGNVYSHLSIDKAVERGTLYNPDPELVNRYTRKYIVIDEGFSSSKFGIIVGQWNQKQIEILEAEELQSPLYEDAIKHIFELREKYGNVLNICFDASRPELGMSLKKKVGERYDWPYVQEKLQYCKKHNIDPATKMIIVPVPFTQENKVIMTSHSRRLLDDSRGLIAINPKFDKLVIALKAAIFDDRGILDKEQSPHNDLLDCFQMLCSLFKFKPANEL